MGLVSCTCSVVQAGLKLTDKRVVQAGLKLVILLPLPLYRHALPQLPYALLYVFECLPAWVFTPLLAWYPWRPKDSVRSPGTGITDSCEPPRGC